MRTVNIDDLISINIKENQSNLFQPKHVLARNICTRIQFSIKYEKSELLKQNKPKKKYEIYKVIIDMNEEYFVGNRKYLPFEKTNDEEVYFNKNIALENCKNYKTISDSAINSCPEIKEIYEKEIYERQNQIEKLKKLDEVLFNKAVRKNTLVKAGKIKEKDNKYDIMLEEKKHLQKQLKEYKLCNQNLIKKLKISLEKYEELKNKKSTIIERIIINFKKRFGGENNENIYC